MEILFVIWDHYLLTPLFNFLILIYLNYAGANLGIAVIILTVILRLVLLPFTILDERGKVVGQTVAREIEVINKDFVNDPVKRKEVIRELLRRRKIRPWAKAVVMGVQLVVLVLLYQVFIHGISANFQSIYPGIPRPDYVNTMFLWFDIAKPNILLAAAIGIYLFIEILIDQMVNHHTPTKREQLFSILFPVLSFLILAILPAVKSIFILTSLIFSSIIAVFTHAVKNAAKQQAKAAANTNH